MIRSTSYSRYYKMPRPMLNGSAVNPRISTSQIAESVAMAQIPETPHWAAPLASHFSCWRRSPSERRQLRAWRPMAGKPENPHRDNEHRRRREHPGRAVVAKG